MMDANGSLIAVLGIGLVFGLKHATEADHVVAVSTIASQQRDVMRSALVGVLWGVGHTISLLMLGMVMLSLRVAIPATVSDWLEFAVALMITGLGAVALWRSLRKRSDMHVHEHSHGGVTHVHVHFHELETRHQPGRTHNHALSAVGVKPLLIGMMHGLAGSGAVTLLVMTQIHSAWISFLYLAIFGLGSAVGMLLMSAMIGLPFAVAAGKIGSLHSRMQVSAAIMSIVFGVWYAYANVNS